ncbi:hypothetical protein L1987_48691 [Smallanthus sonchifolius]|uniref:Uncharacterized protein n=1 Tax=Smallanthus sonchifolius TaxID=185202 RepID=A0ACB9FUA7_9ASTR|nr:hypothetical protein L1987_48691 [Smallanthus sonchifolius]
MEQFSERLLFAGAISTTFPIRFEDVSNIRERFVRFLGFVSRFGYSISICVGETGTTIVGFIFEQPKAD